VVRTVAALVTSYVATSGAILAFYLLFVRRTLLDEFLPATHMPLLSGTGAVAIVVYLLVRSRLEPRHRVPALFLAIAPTAAANTQLISGFLQAPHNLEQSFGVIAVAAVCVLAMKTARQRPWTPLVAAVASCWLLAIYSSQVFAVNASVLQRVPLSTELLDELKTEPESLAFENPDLADVFSLVAPRIHLSALAHSQTLPSPAGVAGVPSTADRFRNYVCVKRQLLSASMVDSINPAAFDSLDRSFRYLNQDFALIHLNRKTEFRTFFDPRGDATHCSPRTLRVFPAFVLGPEVGKAVTLWVGTTPARQWAYASVVELLPRAASAPVNTRLVDIRATLTVTRGCVSVGVLTPDQRSFVSQMAVMPAKRPQVVDLLVEPAGTPNWLVVSNCSADGASSGSVQAVNMFPVERVTTRRVAAVMPGAVPQ
jgi:hypothetical protein